MKLTDVIPQDRLDGMSSEQVEKELLHALETLQNEAQLIARVRDNFANAVNSVQKQLEQLYAESVKTLDERTATYWRSQIGLPVLLLAQAHEAFNFSTALLLACNGRRVARAGWDGKNMWVAVVTQWAAQIDVSDLQAPRLLPFLVMKTANNELVPWLASQTDLLAGDWMLWAPPAVEPEKPADNVVEVPLAAPAQKH